MKLKGLYSHLTDREISSTLSGSDTPPPPSSQDVLTLGSTSKGAPKKKIKIKKTHSQTAPLRYFANKAITYLCKLWGCVIEAIRTTVQEAGGTQTTTLLLMLHDTRRFYTFEPSSTRTECHGHGHAGHADRGRGHTLFCIVLSLMKDDQGVGSKKYN